MNPARWLVLLSLSPLAACKGCTGRQPAQPGLTLADASAHVQFASVEKLGPHHFIASIDREDIRDGAPVHQRHEAIELWWDGWDRFHLRRLVDGSLASEVIVRRARAWVRSHEGAPWSLKDDAELYRSELRATWNVWSEALELFLDRIQLVDEGREVVDGRKAHRYRIGLAPAAADQKRAGEASGGQGRDGTSSTTAEGGPSRKRPRRRIRTGEWVAVSLSGTVWVDEATAVRLAADVTGEARRDDHLRKVRLRLHRSDVGKPQPVKAPRGQAVRRRSNPFGTLPKRPVPERR